MGWLKEMRGRVARGWVEAVYRGAWARRVLWGILFSALLTAALSAWMVPRRLQVAVGEPAPYTITATRPVENYVATRNLREMAARSVRDVYEVDPGVSSAQVLDLTTVFDAVRSVRQSEADEPEKRRRLAGVLPGMADPMLAAVSAATDHQVNQMETEAVNKLRELLTTKVYREDVPDLVTRLEQDWTPQAVGDPNLQRVEVELIKQRLKPNVVLNEAATEQAREEARQQVETVVVPKGVKIVGEREQITQEHYEMLIDLGLVGPEVETRAVAGIALFSLLIVSIAGLYLWRYRADILERDARILLVGFISLLTLVVGLLIRRYSGYLMPMAFGTMLLTILLDARIAIVSGMMLTLLTGLAVRDDISIVLVAGVGIVVGAYALRRVEQRTDLIRAGLLVGAANSLTVLSLYLIAGRPLMELLVWKDVGAGALNGILSAMMAIGMLPFLESIFGVLTPIKLLELANPNHPLLKKLMVEAPGSYHHTILVANMTEAAAEAVGADPMLARVGSYYHDIGKAKRPYFFVENQFGGENPHDKLPPHLSALIIASHVKDGVEMAREHRMPDEIIDFIREHHGDMLISYFYHKATENGKNEYIIEEDFRYEGPRPRSKETALCMLADGCEASVRAMRQKGPLTQEQIEQQVQKIIRDRLQQGQLGRCDLTLRDLDTVQRTFVRVLGGMHHARVDYPNLEARAAGVAKEAGDDHPDQRPAGEGAAELPLGGSGGAGGDPGLAAGGRPPRT